MRGILVDFTICSLDPNRGSRLSPIKTKPDTPSASKRDDLSMHVQSIIAFETCIIVPTTPCKPSLGEKVTSAGYNHSEQGQEHLRLREVPADDQPSLFASVIWVLSGTVWRPGPHHIPTAPVCELKLRVHGAYIICYNRIVKDHEDKRSALSKTNSLYTPF